jgi:hypothetical protein
MSHYEARLLQLSKKFGIKGRLLLAHESEPEPVSVSRILSDREKQALQDKQNGFQSFGALKVKL